MVERLQRWVRSRPLAVTVVILGLVVFVSVVTAMVGREISALAEAVPTYRDNMTQKMSGLRESMRGPISDAARTLSEVTGQLAQTQPASTSPDGNLASVNPVTAPATGAPAPATATIVEPDPLAVFGTLLWPLASVLETTLIVFLLLAMMLAAPHSIRDPVIRLAGLQQISMTTKSLDDAGARVSAYLRSLFIVNLIYGVAIGGGLFVLGVPGAVVCGVLAGLLRFVPIVGVWMGAALPIILALAAFESWTPVMLVVGLIVFLELMNNFALEPWLYHTSTGISSLGVVVALVFWTWIWGGVGLVLAMPMTVFLVVFARQIPQLSALPILLGDQPALSDFARFYQRLLVNDEDEAAAILHKKEESEKPIDRIDAVVMPALGAIRRDMRNGAISESLAIGLAQGMRDITTDWLADQPVEQTTDSATPQSPMRVACLPVTDECDQCAAEILGVCLERAGYAVATLSKSPLLNEIMTSAAEQNVSTVFLSVIVPSSVIQIRGVCKAVRRRLPAAKIVVCLWTRSKSTEGKQEPQFAADVEVVDLREAIEAMSRLTLEHHGGAASQPAKTTAG